MKAYRKNGRIAIVLKLILPRLDGEGEAIKAFNDFYYALAEKYDLSIADSKITSENIKRPITVSVGFYDFTDEYIASHRRYKSKSDEIKVIKRTLRINSEGQTRSVEHTDVYSLKMGAFIK
jgi:hypothetical protein